MRNLAITGVMLVASAVVGNAAAIIGAGTPIPQSEVLAYLGLEWVYAGPIKTGEFGPGNIEAPSFRASEGWRHATAAEWAIRPTWEMFIKPGFTVLDVPAVAGWTDHTMYRFTSEYWSNYSHVDLNDAAAGNISNGSDLGGNGVPETWYVRDGDTPQVPEPSTMALLGLGLSGIAAVGARRRKTN